MRTLSAKVVDPNHLELLESLETPSGEVVQIVVAESDAEEADWKQAAMDQFSKAYDDQDAIYDDL
jgi:hypothetical protein